MKTKTKAVKARGTQTFFSTTLYVSPLTEHLAAKLPLRPGMLLAAMLVGLPALPRGLKFTPPYNKHRKTLCLLIVEQDGKIGPAGIDVDASWRNVVRRAVFETGIVNEWVVITVRHSDPHPLPFKCEPAKEDSPRG